MDLPVDKYMDLIGRKIGERCVGREFARRPEENWNISVRRGHILSRYQKSTFLL
jgi:hypothetical protein